MLLELYHESKSSESQLANVSHFCKWYFLNLSVSSWKLQNLFCCRISLNSILAFQEKEGEKISKIFMWEHANLFETEEQTESTSRNVPKNILFRLLTSSTHWNFEVIVSHQYGTNVSKMERVNFLIGQYFKTLLVNSEMQFFTI